MSSLCQDLINIRKMVYSLIKEGSPAEFIPNEDTITDYVLIKLIKMQYNNIYIKSFTKRKEGETGADWEFWFYSPCTGKYVGMRIQAKILNPYTCKYEHLSYKIGKKKRWQVDVLIESSASSPPKIPMYAFYNYVHWNSCDASSHCFFTNTPYPYIYGITMVDARDIESMVKKKQNGLCDIYPKTFPWEKPFCPEDTLQHADCKLAEGVVAFLEAPESVADRMSNNLHNGRRQNSRDGREGGNFLEFLTKKPPKYVQKLKEDRPLSPDDWEEIDARHIMLIQGENT